MNFCKIFDAQKNLQLINKEKYFWNADRLFEDIQLHSLNKSVAEVMIDKEQNPDSL